MTETHIPGVEGSYFSETSRGFNVCVSFVFLEIVGCAMAALWLSFWLHFPLFFRTGSLQSKEGSMRKSHEVMPDGYVDHLTYIEVVITHRDRGCSEPLY